MIVCFIIITKEMVIFITNKSRALRIRKHGARRAPDLKGELFNENKTQMVQKV